MIAVREIKLYRAEGETHECVSRTITPESPDSVWAVANRVLRQWSWTAPKDGSYHKCDFTLTYEDNAVYQGRIDLQHPSRETPDLAHHVREHLLFIAGRGCPPHMIGEHYMSFLESLQGASEEAATFLDHYDTGASQTSG